MSITVISKKICDLSKAELLEQLQELNNQIDADYKVLHSHKSVKDEIIDEIIKRFGGSEDGIKI